MRVVTCDYLEVEIPVIVFYCDAYWYWNEDDLFIIKKDSKTHYLTLDYVMRSVKYNDRLRRKL